MARQAINTGTTANDGTGDTLRAAAGKINANFTEIYDLLGGEALSTNIKFRDSGFLFDGTSFDINLSFPQPTATRNIDFPDASGIVVLETATQTLTNKKIQSPVLDAPQINDTDSSHQYIFAVSNLAADRTITLPLLTGNDEFTFNDHTQTLKNKTLRSPSISSPQFIGVFRDSNANEMLEIVKSSASAANYIKITSADAGNGPTIEATGTNTDVDLNLVTKGDGKVKLDKMMTSFNTVTTTGTTLNDATGTIIFNPSSNITANLPNETDETTKLTMINKSANRVTLTVDTWAGTGTSKSVMLTPYVMADFVWASNGWYTSVDSGGGLGNKIIVT